ncbi:MAG: triose-phosphate isomerase [Gammaproteobacteria bacterium]
MRKPLVAGNWKMHGSRASVNELVDHIKASSIDGIDVAVFPACIFIPQVAQNLSETSLQWGSQDLYFEPQGAYTGEISGPMLADFGCHYVLVGHSERREHFHEDDKIVSLKFAAAIDAGLEPVLCVGETESEREAEQTSDVIRRQLDAVLNAVGIEGFAKAVIAYEPVWAIGTGNQASPEQAQTVHAFIREYLNQLSPEVAQSLRILYGGSVKPENAAGLFSMPDIDGGLVGGASLNAEHFVAICEAAQQ